MLARRGHQRDAYWQDFGTPRWQLVKKSLPRSSVPWKGSRISAFGPTLPSLTPGWDGSYPGISCHALEMRYRRRGSMRVLEKAETRPDEKKRAAFTPEAHWRWLCGAAPPSPMRRCGWSWSGLRDAFSCAPSWPPGSEGDDAKK